MHLIVDGRHVETDRTDIRLLDLLTAEGCAPPALCDDPRLKPAGDCRLCLVEVEGESHPAASCVVAAREGMVVRTNSERLIHFRRIILGWMAEKVSPEATARHPDKALHRLMKVEGIAPAGKQRSDAECDLSHPLIRVDMAQCLDCFRCVRICEEVQGQSVWHVLARGLETLIVPDSRTTLAESSCVGCWACVDT